MKTDSSIILDDIRRMIVIINHHGKHTDPKMTVNKIAQKLGVSTDMIYRLKNGKYKRMVRADFYLNLKELHNELTLTENG